MRFTLVDRITDLEPGKRIETLERVAISEL